MIIDWQVIPHKRHRYETVGDYFWQKIQLPATARVLHFRVSKMSDARYPLLVFLHEVIEYFLCRAQGVKVRDIDKFDTAYEAARAAEAQGDESLIAPCGCRHREEPGDDPHAPYYLQHQTATKCEHLIADALGVKWKTYEQEVESL